MTLREACLYGRRELERAKVPEAALDAWYLLEYISGCTKSHYYAWPEEELTVGQEARFVEAVKRRAGRLPLQYITGEQEFMGLSFLVDCHVLIPRQDTEILVEEALRHLRPGMEFLDLCTGSGCILISLAKHCPGAEGTGSDISENALKIAERNAKRLSSKVKLVYSDLFASFEREKFDMIVSNPPYIRSGELSGLMEEVRDYEPRIALDGHEDGLYFYRKIVRESRNHLKKNGKLVMEIGCDQGSAVTGLLREAGYCGIEVKRDLAGLDRVAGGIYPG